MRMRFQLGAAIALTGLLGACSGTHSSATSASDPGKHVEVVAVESVYADIAARIGGDAVRVTALQHGVDADPHAYEPTPADASAIAGAQVVIRNGDGYDAFVQKLLDASPSDDRTVIDVGNLIHAAPGSNPHLWYDVAADRALIGALGSEFDRRTPSATAKIAANVSASVEALNAWDAGISHLRKDARGKNVATTEPVFDFVIDRAGITIATPPSFALAIEQGNDPAPQDVAKLDAAIPTVNALVYNAQTVSPATTRIVSLAKAARVPIVDVTESMPDGMHAFAWLEAETHALDAALAGRG